MQARQAKQAKSEMGGKGCQNDANAWTPNNALLQATHHKTCVCLVPFSFHLTLEQRSATKSQTSEASLASQAKQAKQASVKMTDVAPRRLNVSDVAPTSEFEFVVMI